MDTDTPSSGIDSPAPTIYDSGLETRVNVLRLPGVAMDALRIVWAGGRGLFIASTALMALRGVGFGVQLLVARQGLQGLLKSEGNPSSMTAALPWALTFGGITAVLMFASAVSREQEQILGQSIARYMQSRIFDVTAAVDLKAFDTPAFHNRIQRAQMNQHQPLVLTSGLSTLVASTVGILGVALALGAIEPLLIPVILIVPFPAWLVASLRGDAFFRFFCRMTSRDRERQYLTSLLTDREPAAEVRALGLPPFLTARYDSLYGERMAELRRVARRQLVYSFGANLGIGAALTGMLLLLAWLTISGRLQVAEAGIAAAGLAVVAARLLQAGYAAGDLFGAGLYIRDYLTFVDLLRQVTVARPTDPAPDGFDRVTVEEVSFTYPNSTCPTLKGVSLHIDRGEIVALVGENGSGKTTLARLLAGLYHPDHGTIRWDHISLATVDPDDFRRSVAIAPQNYIHFHLPARDNIGLGRYEAIDDLARIRAAAHQAGVDSVVAGLPYGYETMLGPQFIGGTDLSEGQWQRLALARVFFRDAPFVILDEPTAALDPRAEYGLFERIRALLADRTVLLISHRLANVLLADRIYVLDSGRVVEAGTHQQLIAVQGLYAELFQRQAAAYTGATARR